MYTFFGFITQMATLVSQPPNIPLGLTLQTPARPLNFY